MRARAVAALTLGVLGAVVASRSLGPDSRLSSGEDAPGRALRMPIRSASETAEDLGTHGSSRRLVRPTGLPLGISCSGVRRVLEQIQVRFPAPVSRPSAARFAELVTGWLDPHALWSAASDAPPAALIATEAARLLAEIEPDMGGARCDAARAIGAAVELWVSELRALHDESFALAPVLTRGAAIELALEPAFDDGEVLVPARHLARALGRRLGAVGAAFGDELGRYVAAGRARYFPDLDAEAWQGVVLAAALRAYVAAVDPHGEWAPRDEEWSLYSGDPSLDDPERLWGDMVRTALGVRAVDQPKAPLEVDDLVLAIDGVPTAGLSVEQAEQLARVPAGPEPGLAGESPRRAVVLRQGEDRPRELELLAASDGVGDVGAALLEPEEELDVYTVPYAKGYVAVVSVPFVRDNLGEALADIVRTLAQGDPPLGLLLDLRGNAGGSLDGAADALSLFLPRVPAFTLLHAGHVVEVLETTEADPAARFAGPLAALVDGSTASAAEMIAGALDRYGRGVVVGEPTYGKGCVQEYFDDDVGAGVLRLTTLLFTLPDGSPVQRAGVLPVIPLELPDAPEHERDLPGALRPVSGPDVRTPIAATLPWPSFRGRLGPCPDPAVCASLRLLGRVPARAALLGIPARDRRRADSTRH